MKLFELLSAVTVPNRDDRVKFTVTDRLDAIAGLLRNSKYRRINTEGLFHLYAAKPTESYRGSSVTIVSSHVDCVPNFKRCFSEIKENGMLKGTYDNSITNTAVLSLMLAGSLPDDVLTAFTGAEEIGSNGARDLLLFLKKNGISIRHLFVLDVTDMGWEEEADFTIENNFWRDDCGQKIVSCAESLPYPWRFVPSDPDRVPGFVKEEYRIPEEAEEDESWLYDEYRVNCCSLCLPVDGDMHSGRGVLVRQAAFLHYTEALNRMLRIRQDQN